MCVCVDPLHRSSIINSAKNSHEVSEQFDARSKCDSIGNAQGVDIDCAGVDVVVHEMHKLVE